MADTVRGANVSRQSASLACKEYTPRKFAALTGRPPSGNNQEMTNTKIDMRGRNSHVSHFKPGVSGNPGGKPVGTRNAFSAALWAIYTPAGRNTVLMFWNGLARHDTSRYLGICSTLIPKDVTVSLEQRLPGGMSAQDLEIFSAIKAAIPDANDRQPGEVLNYVLEALRSH